MTDQRLYLLAADRMLQIVGSKLVVADTDILIVNTVPWNDRLSFQPSSSHLFSLTSLPLRAGAQIAPSVWRAHRLPCVKARPVVPFRYSQSFDSIKLTLV